MDWEDLWSWDWDFGMPDLSELNWLALIFGLIGGVLGVYVSSSVDVGLFWKILVFIGSTIASYLLIDSMMQG